MLRRYVLVMAIFATSLSIAGCASTRVPGPPYPSRIARGATLDIQVFRKGATIEMVNATPVEFPRSRLWLNGRYSAEIEGLKVGERLSLPLRMFRDEFGDTIRAGGFFATERPDPVVLAEIERLEVGDLQGMVVVEHGGG